MKNVYLIQLSDWPPKKSFNLKCKTVSQMIKRKYKLLLRLNLFYTLCKLQNLFLSSSLYFLFCFTRFFYIRVMFTFVYIVKYFIYFLKTVCTVHIFIMNLFHVLIVYKSGWKRIFHVLFFVWNISLFFSKNKSNSKIIYFLFKINI